MRPKNMSNFFPIPLSSYDIRGQLKYTDIWLDNTVISLVNFIILFKYIPS